MLWLPCAALPMAMFSMRDGLIDCRKRRSSMLISNTSDEGSFACTKYPVGMVVILYRLQIRKSSDPKLSSATTTFCRRTLSSSGIPCIKSWL